MLVKNLEKNVDFGDDSVNGRTRQQQQETECKYMDRFQWRFTVEPVGLQCLRAPLWACNFWHISATISS
jgi:hypothetical protein